MILLSSNTLVKTMMIKPLVWRIQPIREASPAGHSRIFPASHTPSSLPDRRREQRPGDGEYRHAVDAPVSAQPRDQEVNRHEQDQDGVRSSFVRCSSTIRVGDRAGEEGSNHEVQAAAFGRPGDEHEPDDAGVPAIRCIEARHQLR